jgi:tetratricopeptide (TPR) repeat protein
MELGLYDSIEYQCSLNLSSKMTSEGDVDILYSFMTESQFMKQEYRKCISSLNSAYQHLGYSSSSSRESPSVNNARLARFKEREAKCYFFLKEHTAALKSLEAIPSSLRSLDTKMTLIRCYKANGLRRQASMIQLDVLRQLPFALEIIEDLLMQNVSPAEVTAAVEAGTSRGAAGGCGSADDVAQLKATVNMLVVKHQLAYGECRELFENLLAPQLPKSPFLLRHAAECYALAGQSPQALAAYQRLRQADPQCTRNMDMYGYLLYEAGAEAELARLAGDVMALLEGAASEARRAEGWLLLAMLAALRGEAERALRFLEKAVAADPRRWLTYLFKGRYYHAQAQRESAVVSLMQANSAFKSLPAYALLVETHLQLGNAREASYTAREAVATFSKNATPLVLLGKVLMQGPGAATANENCAVKKHGDALRCFDKAIKLDAGDARAHQLRSEVLVENGLLAEGAAALELALRAGAGVAARVQLGRVLGLAGRLEDALQTLHVAAALDGDGAAGALVELDRLERRLKVDRDRARDREEPAAAVKATPPQQAQQQRPTTRASTRGSADRVDPRVYGSAGAADTPGVRLTGRISFGGDDEEDEEEADEGQWEEYEEFAAMEAEAEAEARAVGFLASDSEEEEEADASGETEPAQGREEPSPAGSDGVMQYDFDSPNL